MTQVSLLVVTDSDEETELRRALNPLGFSLKSCENGSAAMRIASQSPPHLILVDARDDPLGSAQLCKSMRSVRETSAIPLIVLSRDLGSEERLKLLEAGADDCWPEPVDGRELRLRLSAFARRFQTLSADRLVRYADIELDVDRYRARRNGTAIDLTPMQLKLLRHLMENPSVVFSRKRLLEEVWENPALDEGAVTACVVRLRRALNKAGPNIIKRVPFAGYVLEAASPARCPAAANPEC